MFVTVTLSLNTMSANVYGWEVIVKCRQHVLTNHHQWVVWLVTTEQSCVSCAELWWQWLIMSIYDAGPGETRALIVSSGHVTPLYHVSLHLTRHPTSHHHQHSDNIYRILLPAIFNKGTCLQNQRNRSIQGFKVVGEKVLFLIQCCGVLKYYL